MKRIDWLLIMGLLLIAIGLGINFSEKYDKKEKLEIVKKADNWVVEPKTDGEILGVININSAGAEELDKLSGIGPALAGRIIDYRVKNKGFRSKEEIKLVKGIGESVYGRIKDKIGI